MKRFILISAILACAAPAFALKLGPISGPLSAPNAPLLSGISVASSTSLSLGWSYAGTGSAATSISVFRGTTEGGESSTPVATGVTASPWVDTGLTTSTAYYYYLKAVNAAGASTVSNELTGTPVGSVYAPSAPTIGSATAGNASATVAFTPGTVDGTHSAATSYVATSTPGSVTGTASGSPIPVSGLTNGTAYTFTVHATNSAGSSAESGPSNSVTPSAGTTGLLDFETASLTPNGLTGAYSNEVVGNGTTAGGFRDNATAHSGTYSEKLVGSTASPWVQLSRQLTFPSSGVVSFTRWVKFSSMVGNSNQVVVGIASDQTVSQYLRVGVFVYRASGVYSGFGYYSSSAGAIAQLVTAANAPAGSWYKVKVDMDCSANASTLTVFASDGSTVLGTASNIPNWVSNVSGQTMWSILGRDTGGNTIWFDDVVDGI